MLARVLLRDRRRAWLWWAVGLSAMNAFVVSAFGSIRGQDQLEETLESLPEAIRALVGGDSGLSFVSPAGYLNARMFANFLPILLTVFVIGVAGRAVAGEEDAGRLEVVLAHPVARTRLLVERGLAVAALLTGLAAVATIGLVAMTPAVGLDEVGFGNMVAASTGSFLLATLHGSVTYGVGAWWGHRGTAVGAGAVLTAGGFLLQSLAAVSDLLEPLRWLSPWHWFIDARPIVDGWSPLLLPGLAVLAASGLAFAVGAWRFRTRDIGSA